MIGGGVVSGEQDGAGKTLLGHTVDDYGLLAGKWIEVLFGDGLHEERFLEE